MKHVKNVSVAKAEWDWEWDFEHVDGPWGAVSRWLSEVKGKSEIQYF